MQTRTLVFPQNENGEWLKEKKRKGTGSDNWPSHLWLRKKCINTRNLPSWWWKDRGKTTTTIIKVIQDLDPTIRSCMFVDSWIESDLRDLNQKQLWLSSLELEAQQCRRSLLHSPYDGLDSPRATKTWKSNSNNNHNNNTMNQIKSRVCVCVCVCSNTMQIEKNT